MRILTAIVAIFAIAGSTALGGAQPGAVSSLAVDKSGADLELSWNPDCGSGDAYSIYRGDLSAGYRSVAIDTCDLTNTTATIPVGVPGGEFFLVVPSLGGSEGSYGWDGLCVERPAAATPCYPQGLVDGCADLLVPDGCGGLDCGNGIYEPFAQIPEECDDANTCPLDGCDGSSCTRSESVVVTSMLLNTLGDGFDLDNADGDNNIYTGVDNILGSNGILADQANTLLVDSINDGSLRLTFSLSDLDSFTDDPDLTWSGHSFVDPACPTFPVYSAANLPPWVSAPPAEVFSDLDELFSCQPAWLATDADDPSNGLYPTNSNPAQPPAPYVSVFSVGATLPLFGAAGQVWFPRLEATVLSDGARVTGLSNGLLGLVAAPRTLVALPGFGTCPTVLHAVMCLVGGPDIDIEGTGLDTIQVSGCGIIPCVFGGNERINSCVDGETGATIPSVVDGDCVLDPRMTDGHSAAFDVTAPQIDVVEQVSSLAYCP